MLGIGLKVLLLIVLSLYTVSVFNKVRYEYKTFKTEFNDIQILNKAIQWHVRMNYSLTATILTTTLVILTEQDWTYLTLFGVLWVIAGVFNIVLNKIVKNKIELKDFSGRVTKSRNWSDVVITLAGILLLIVSYFN